MAMLLFLPALCYGMSLEAGPPAVARATQAGRSLAVSPSSWERADASWRLVVSSARDPKSARMESRWRVDSDSVETTVRHFNVTLQPNPGLGIMLEERMLGSDESMMLPLVVVDGLVKGGAAAMQSASASDGACLTEEDTLIRLYCAGISVDIEAASYDYTVDAIGTALAAYPAEPLTLTVGRIVRRGRAVVATVEPDGSESSFTVYEGENLRMGLLRRGRKLNDKTAPRYDGKAKGSGDCGGNGLCATCVVSVLDGAEYLTPKGASERNLLKSVARWRQSCRAYVQCPEGVTDVEIKLATNPRSTDSDA